MVVDSKWIDEERHAPKPWENVAWDIIWYMADWIRDETHNDPGYENRMDIGLSADIALSKSWW